MKSFTIYRVAGRAVRRNKFTQAFLLILLTSTLVTGASAAQLVVNGGFEDPVVTNPDGWSTYYGQNFLGTCLEPPEEQCNGGTLVPGWSVEWSDDGSDGRLEIQRGFIAGVWPHRGDQKAELDSHHRLGVEPNHNVTIFQTLQTCERSAYTMNYAWKSRTMIPGDNDVDVLIDGATVRGHMINSDWEMETINFVSGDTGETTIEFASLGDATTLGMFLDSVSVTGMDGSEPSNCGDPQEICADGKPRTLTLLYDGNDFTDHSQVSNEVIIEPAFVASFPNPAYIKVYGHKKKNPQMLGAYTLDIGQTFDVSGPRNRIPPRLKFEIWDSENGGTLIQTVQFHTSCSQTLDTLDEFGAITVWGATH
jgi:hypothetical protein